MIKKFIRLSWLVFLALGCVSVPAKKEDIFIQAEQIKEEHAQLTLVTQKQQKIPTDIIDPISPDSSSEIKSELSLQEKFIFKTKYLGITIGEFVIFNHGETTIAGKEVYKFELVVNTNTFFGKLFRTKKRYVSFVEAERMRVLRHEEYNKEDVLESAVDFDYVKHEAVYKNFLNNEEKITTIPDHIVDVVGGGFYLRLKAREIGDTIELKIYADEKIYDYVGLLHSLSAVNLSGKKHEEAYRLKSYLFYNGKLMKNISADVYLSTETSRRPLQAALKARLGSVNVVLVESAQN